MMFCPSHTGVVSDRVRSWAFPAQDENGLVEFLLLSTNGVSSLSDPLNRSVSGKLSRDIRPRRRALISIDQPEVGVKKFLFVIGKFRFGLEIPEPLGSLSREHNGESALFDLLPTDVVDQDMNGRAVYVFKHGGEFRCRRMNKTVVLKELEVGPYDPGLFGAEGVFDQA
jgi:hypothetical protein